MIAARAASAVLAATVLAGCTEHSAGGPPVADGSDRSVRAAVDAVTSFPTQLDPRLWNGEALKPEIRQKTMQIVDRIVTTSGIPGLTVDSVELFGSNASYEYDDASDFGVHVFTHSADSPADKLNRLLKLLNDEVERRQEGRITFNGVPLEVTFHGERGDTYRPEHGIGQYSVSQGRWIERPVQQTDRFDRDQMAADMKTYIGKYNQLVSDYSRDPKVFDCSRFGALDDELGAYRNSGFAKGSGSRSTSNLAYRALRRINVNVPAMLDTLGDECTFTQESIG